MFKLLKISLYLDIKVEELQILQGILHLLVVEKLNHLQVIEVTVKSDFQ
jgi:hypothetical protein